MRSVTATDVMNSWKYREKSKAELRLEELSDQILAKVLKEIELYGGLD